ncbi:hypothetical protein GCM10009716_34090 [Streptomyces sodiiphilus]|uniref:Uncharacterized protein n=1 Tax=Streptomyces sodiiphilus TaxID=226217 RepID=A0ABN2PIJ0_9ACTN
MAPGAASPAGTGGPDDVAWLLVWLLVLEQHIFHAEAETRWLDHCETRLVRLAEEVAGGETTDHGPAAEPPPEPGTRRGHTGNAGGTDEAAQRPLTASRRTGRGSAGEAGA